MNAEFTVLALAELLGKSVLILLAAILITRGWPRSSAARRHLLWLSAFITLLLLPLTKTVMPRLAFSLPQQSVVRIVLSSAPQDSAAFQSPSSLTVRSSPSRSEPWRLPGWREVSLLVWLSGAALIFAYRFLGTLQLVRLRHRSVPARGMDLRILADEIARELGIARPVELRISAECRVPLIWGLRRPLILLPDGVSTWSREQLTAVLRHEFGHVARHDYLTRLVAHFVCALYWPNPIVWVAARRLRRAQEEACDDLVLGAGVRAEQYAMHLVAVARGLAHADRAGAHALAMAQSSTLHARVLAIVDPARDRRPLSGGVVVLCVLSGGIALGGSAFAQVKGDAPVSVATEAVSTRADLGSPSNLLHDKVVRLTIPEVELGDATLHESLEYLERKSIEADDQEVDPAKRGVKFVVKFRSEKFEERRLTLGVFTGAPRPGSMPLTHAGQVLGPKRFSLSLANVSVLAAVAAVAREAELEVFVGFDSVVLHPKGVAPIGERVPSDDATFPPQSPPANQPAATRPGLEPVATASARPKGVKSDDDPVEIESEESRVVNGIAHAIGAAKFSHAKETITSAEMKYDPKSRIAEAKGTSPREPAKLSYKEVIIEADLIRYKIDLKMVEAIGNATLTQPGQSVVNNRLWFDLRKRSIVREIDYIQARAER